MLSVHCSSKFKAGTPSLSLFLFVSFSLLSFVVLNARFLFACVRLLSNLLDRVILDKAPNMVGTLPRKFFIVGMTTALTHSEAAIAPTLLQTCWSLPFLAIQCVALDFSFFVSVHFLARGRALRVIVSMLEQKDADSDDFADEETRLQQMEQLGYSAAFCRLAWASSVDHDPMASVTNLKEFLARSLQQLFQAHPGQVRTVFLQFCLLVVFSSFPLLSLSI